MCLYGQGIVRGLLDEFGTKNLKGFAVWLPMMPKDDLDFARGEADDIGDRAVAHAWDPESELGGLYSKTLNLRGTAWDIYLLYAPGIRWEEDEPPQPSFWMHQLPADQGAPQELLLNASRIQVELKALMEGRAAADLDSAGLGLHVRGLMNLLSRAQVQYSSEAVRGAIEDSRKANLTST